jgi:diguanylate cyclase (GGDEF)-like protein
VTEYLEGWLNRANELSETFAVRLYSVAEFEDRLNTLVKAAGSPFTAVAVHLNPGADRPVTELGTTAADDETDRKTLQLGATTSAIVRAWSSAKQTATDEAGMGAIRGLVEAWWRVADRDGMTGLLQFSRAGIPQALAGSVSAWSGHRQCPVSFGDVDRFKKLNDALGQARGDEAIALVAGCFSDMSPRDGVVLRRGGDEFVLALPPRPLRQLVDELTALRSEVERRIQDAYQGLEGDPLGFSVGVAMVSGEDVVAQGWDERAERTMKPGGAKQYGRVSFELDSGYRGIENDAARTSVESVRARLGDEEPFGNVWLRWLSGTTHSALTGGIDSEMIAKAVEIIDPQWTDSAIGRVLEADGGAVEGSRELCALDLGLAIAHGATRALAGLDAAEPVIMTYGSEGKYAKVMVAEHLLFEQGSAESDIVDVRFPTMAGDPSKIDARRLIVITIGESAELLHPYLYADRIYLDDRPTRGGGLPDFWEAALAQVVDSLEKHPNVLGVVIDGDPDYGIQTMKWMGAGWTDEDLTYLATKLDLTTQNLAAVSARLDGAVTLLKEGSSTELEVAERVQSNDTPLVEAATTAPVVGPRLQRQLVARPFLLDRTDGCRVQTASIAYPVALDIVRQTDSDLYDSQQRPFSELIDFRIQLTDPTEDPIPRYYLADRQSLDEYFEREFRSSGGKFYEALAENSQYNHVLAHLCDCINEDAYASRRAVLVLPHVPTSADVSPLGLVSVRAIPRLEGNGTVRLDFSFTWRTVEAIVGLPYSLFGSIRFAEEITKHVAGDLMSTPSKTIRMGQLSYIAHSLHMYNDGYGASVARRIVNDESF